jgi:hypothetical protein
VGTPLPPDLQTSPAGGRITRFYTLRVVGILLSLWTYLCTLVMAAVAPHYLKSDGTLKFVLWVPVVTLVIVVTIIYFAYRASDEDVRHRILKCMGLTGAILAFSTLGYFCLERVGYPNLSMIWVNLYGWSIFTALMLWVLYRAR